MATHVHQLALINIFRMAGMRRVDESVLGAEEVVNVIALDRLRQKWQAKQKDNPDQKEEMRSQSAALFIAASGFHRTNGRRAAVT